MNKQYYVSVAFNDFVKQHEHNAHHRGLGGHPCDEGNNIQCASEYVIIKLYLF